MASKCVTSTTCVIEQGICVSIVSASRFNKAMTLYKNHFSDKNLKRAFKKATTQDDFAPISSARSAVLLHAEFQISSALMSLLKGFQFSYKPEYLEVAGDNQSELGNSVHNINSVAQKSINLYGVRIFKALGIVHEILSSRQYVPTKDNADELLWWFETIFHDLKYGKNGTIGYGKLVSVYITYLKCLLASQSIASNFRSSSAAQIFTAHQNLALSNHVFREMLSLDIQASSPSRVGAKVWSLTLVVNDALGFTDGEYTLLKRMREDSVQFCDIEDTERVFARRREEVRNFMTRCRRILRTQEDGLELMDEKFEGLIL